MGFELKEIRKSFEIPAPAEPGAGFARGLARVLAPPRRELRALDGVSFRAAPGEAVGVIGANGSGKSTLLKILAGVMTPDSGEVVVSGRVGALLEVGAGFHPDLTGAENVALNAALIGLGRRETEARIAEIIAFSELERFMDMPVKRYSSGMTVRLGFAIAIQLQPDILVLDETFAVGDARFQARALGKIREMKASGVTMALVSHNTDLILELADRVVWLDCGGVRMDGPPTEVVPEYRRDCGARLTSADRLGPARPRSAVEGNGGREKTPWRITSAAWRGMKVDHAGVIEAESDSAVAIEFTLARGDEAETPELGELEIEAIFTRDDQRAVAHAVAALGGEKSSSRQDAKTPRSGPLRLVLDPVRLAHGEYQASLTLRRRGRTGEDMIHSAPVAGKLRITTPLPYDFRLIAKVEARWESA